MYYAEMGKAVGTDDFTGNFTMTPEARQWYEKSVDILKRATPIDRAFNELNRRKEMTRWKNLNDIPDAGLAPVYLFLGDSQLRLNQLDDAAESYRYAQRLDSVSSASYIQLGLIRLAQNKIDEAINYLLQGIILDPSRDEPWPVLANIYRALGEPQAVIFTPQARQVNAGVPLVQQHLRTAMRDLVRAQLRGKQYELARTLRKQAIDVHKAPAGLFDPLFEEAGVAIVEAPPPVEKDE
jgi:tetratricopeptide (TPR) repeat protein